MPNRVGKNIHSQISNGRSIKEVGGMLPCRITHGEEGLAQENFVSASWQDGVSQEHTRIKIGCGNPETPYDIGDFVSANPL